MMRLQRHFKDLGIEGAAANWYDSNTRKHRLTEMQEYAQEAVKHIHNGSSVLEVAPGPGYLAIELAKLGNYQITGIDISQDFVNIAKRNAVEAGVKIDFQKGNVANLPFSDNSFDFIICTAAFKNFKEPLRAFGEMYRVLRLGGTALIIDMNKNISDQQIDTYTKNLGAKGRERLFMKWTFKYFLRNGAYTREEFTQLISKTRFSKYEIKEKGIGLYLYLTKLQ